MFLVSFFVCLFVCLFVFWLQALWDLSSQTGDWICTHCIWSQSLNHWASKEVPHLSLFNSHSVCQNNCSLAAYLFFHLDHFNRSFNPGILPQSHPALAWVEQLAFPLWQHQAAQSWWGHHWRMFYSVLCPLYETGSTLSTSRGKRPTSDTGKGHHKSQQLLMSLSGSPLLPHVVILSKFPVTRK